MMEPEADPGADSSSPVDVTVAGGHFGHAVLGTQIINRKTVVHQHGADVDASALPSGHFRLSPHITVSEIDPINRDSRIYRAKLHSEILGDWEIAVKILSDGERQRREARIHFKVPHHKNIVKRILTDTFKYQGQSCIYIAMEQCDPQNLYAYVVSLVEKNEPYDAEMFISFAYQIATGLEFLHRHKILNRDLKPENILLSADKKIAKIADFGMSKEMTGEASTVSTVQPGTDGWRSPEILKNVKRITLASDIFSLGLIFHFLWSYGKHAFGDDSHAWNLYIKRGMNMTLDGLKIPNSNDAKRLLKSLLSQIPTERPSALEVLRDCVFEVSRPQSDSAAIYTGIAVVKARGYSEGAPEPAQKSKSFFAKLWKNLDRKSEENIATPEGAEDIIATPEGAEENIATLGSLTEKTRTNIQELRRNLQGYGIRVERFKRDFQFGKEWEGRFSGLKVIIRQFNEDNVDKYENTVDILTNLEHENIMHFINKVSEICVIVTEFYNETLQEYLRGNGKQAELTDLLWMAAQVASGMDFLHRKKYIHCDLHAGNVAITVNLLCKISGFVLTRYVGAIGSIQLLQGAKFPIKWTAPEVCFAGQLTFKNDVWSFGVLLWEIVTRGQIPYPGMTNADVSKSICSGYRMCKPKQCPSRLYFDIMRSCWDENPGARPTFQCLAKSLLSFDTKAEEKETSISGTNIIISPGTSHAPKKPDDETKFESTTAVEADAGGYRAVETENLVELATSEETADGSSTTTSASNESLTAIAQTVDEEAAIPSDLSDETTISRTSVAKDETAQSEKEARQDHVTGSIVGDETTQAGATDFTNISHPGASERNPVIQVPHQHKVCTTKEKFITSIHGGKLKKENCSVSFPPGILKHDENIKITVESGAVSDQSKHGIPITPILGCDLSHVELVPGFEMEVELPSYCLADPPVPIALLSKSSDSESWEIEKMSMLGRDRKLKFKTSSFSRKYYALMHRLGLGSRVECILTPHLYYNDLKYFDFFLSIDHTALIDRLKTEHKSNEFATALVMPEPILAKLDNSFRVELQFEPPSVAKFKIFDNVKFSCVEVIKKKFVKRRFKLQDIPDEFESKVIEFCLKISSDREKTSIPCSLKWPLFQDDAPQAPQEEPGHRPCNRKRRLAPIVL